MSEKRKKAPPDLLALECGKRVAECRKAVDLTQEQLSKATGYRPRRSGLSPSQIGNFEQGTRRIGYEEAEILARVFPEYPAPYFMGVLDKREAKVLLVLRTEGNPIQKAS
jgi:transcriptional regulator with XRE-family HTH domain